MSDIMKIRLLTMIDNEMKQVVGAISNESLWADGSTTEEETQMHYDNVADLEEYKSLLLRMREQVVEDEFDV
jgi:hypothetical protein